ncbi:unnamed protein product [Tilletia caries]|uniref:LysM domain-containing protein n=3 Tax=Tilletia TaxID=13289 RepID=A0ABN7ILL4_9BASI|nr:unnamed protein product [Tilletia caries]
MSPRKSSARQAKAKATGPSGESSTPTPAPAASNARRRWNITGPRVPDLAPASDPLKDDDFTESSDDSDADQDVKKEEGVKKEEEPEDDFSGLLNHRFSSVKGEPEPDSLAKHKKAAKRAEARPARLCKQPIPHHSPARVSPGVRGAPGNATPGPTPGRSLLGDDVKDAMLKIWEANRCTNTHCGEKSQLYFACWPLPGGSQHLNLTVDKTLSWAFALAEGQKGVKPNWPPAIAPYAPGAPSAVKNAQGKSSTSDNKENEPIILSQSSDDSITFVAETRIQSTKLHIYGADMTISDFAIRYKLPDSIVDKLLSYNIDQAVELAEMKSKEMAKAGLEKGEPIKLRAAINRWRMESAAPTEPETSRPQKRARVEPSSSAGTSSKAALTKSTAGINNAGPSSSTAGPSSSTAGPSSSNIGPSSSES